MPAAKKATIHFKQERETKRTKRFQEEDEPFAVDKLYVKNEVLKALGNPERLKVTIEPAE